ncbi:C69 family dipeptidase [Mobiluncus curtisii]|uniref:C69 family dipeptidase n=1 Tax=Mobiluncus curtisii TaxID=2051 RepID=UPI002092163A|nr:C69 family dipeptidase [Mobiluncus curtisii]
MTTCGGFETVGGHHWLARRLPEECYAVIANQFSLDDFDFEDALGEGARLPVLAGFARICGRQSSGHCTNRRSAGPAVQSAPGFWVTFGFGSHL